ncbi:MAG: hypothetical protein ACM3P1_11000 [Candidatus Saccharibacteria bacterium]
MMNRSKIFLTILAFILAIILAAPLIVNPILKRKILVTLHQKYPDYDIRIDKLRWMLIPSQLTLTNITVASKPVAGNSRFLKGEIASIRFKGIENIKALFNRGYEVHQIVVSGSNIEGKVPFHKKEKLPITSTLNVRIDQILFDGVNLSLRDSSTAQSLVVREGMLKLKNLDIRKKDTLGILRQFDLRAYSVISNSPDSMYTFRANGIVYADSLKKLSVDSLSLNPNYKRYDFTAKHPYEADRFLVKISDLKLDKFQADDFYNSGNLVSSCLWIGNMNLEAFRDKRKPDSHEKKPPFQKYIYTYPGFLKIDSMLFNGGSITYIEHAEKAAEPGRVHLDDFRAKVYNLTNDSIYQSKDTTLTIKAQAMLMGKSKMDILFKARLFDPMNTFSVKGSLAAMQVKDLNPILEKNAFIYANSTKVNQLKFSFTANDKKTSGKMIMLYDGLDLAVKNKHTKDTTGLKEQIISLIANKSTWDSNPLPKEEARVGIIDYERDPTKSVINYCVKSVVSGIRSTIIKHPKNKKSFFQRIFTNGDDKVKERIKESSLLRFPELS